MRIGNRVINLRGPSERPLFSERNGFMGRIPLLWGWRITFRKIEQGEW